jgi:TRAP-type transport system periplasmic protein
VVIYARIRRLKWERFCTASQFTLIMEENWFLGFAKKESPQEKEVKMKRGILLMVFAVVLLVCIVHIGQGVSYSASQPVELKVVTFLPKTEPRIVIFQDLLKLIEQKSNGAIICKYLGGPEVIGPLEIGDNVRLGNIQMAVAPGAFFSGLVRISPIISLSQFSMDEERKRGLWDKLTQIFESSGLRPVGRFMPHNDPAYFVGFRKVKPSSIKDLAGLKVGFGSTVNKAWAEKLGMTFVQIPLQEGYNALEKGVVDAYTGTVGDHLNYAYCEAEAYIVDHPIYGNNGYIIMNLKTWNNLPQALKNAIQDALITWEPQSMKIQRELEAKQKQQILGKKKAQFIKLPPEEATKYVQAVYDAEWPTWESKLPELTKVLRPLMSK